MAYSNATDTGCEAAGVQSASLPPIGVHVLAFGAQGYSFAACNLAATLRHFTPGVEITLRAGPGCDIPKTHAHLFDDVQVLTIPPDRRGKPDPGFAKANLLDVLPKGKSLYIDADSVVMQDITPFLDALDSLGKPFAMEVIGKGDVTKPPRYFDWIEPRRMVSKFGLKADATLYGVQSSWMFFDNPKCALLMQQVSDLHEQFKPHELRGHWGYCIPDEVSYSAMCSLNGYDPSGPEGFITFGSRTLHQTPQEVMASHTILSIYGQGVGKPLVRPLYLDTYDHVCRIAYAALGMEHRFQWPDIMRDKYVNTTKR